MFICKSFIVIQSMHQTSALAYVSSQFYNLVYGDNKPAMMALKQ